MNFDKLHPDVDAARATYCAERHLPVKTAGWVIADRLSAAEAIASLTAEWGQSKAVEQMLAMPQSFGEHGATTLDQLIADQSDSLEPMLDCLLDARDRPASLTREREDFQAAGQPGWLRAVNSVGRDFAADARLDEIRVVVNPHERYALSEQRGRGAMPVIGRRRYQTSSLRRIRGSEGCTWSR